MSGTIEQLQMDAATDRTCNNFLPVLIRQGEHTRLACSVGRPARHLPIPLRLQPVRVPGTFLDGKLQRLVWLDN